MAKYLEDYEKYIAAQHLIEELIKKLPHEKIDPKIHNINYLPEETVYFFDKAYMPEFESIDNIPLKNFKLINYDKPAINIIFNSKHKYFVKKKIKETELKALIHLQLQSLEELLVRLINQHSEELKNLNPKQQKELKAKFKITEQELKDKIVLSKDIFENTAKYESSISNYYKYYTYTFVTFKYMDLATGLLVSENSHIIKNVMRNGRLYKVKTNIIFVDIEAMKNHCPYQNKKVETFLNSFDHRFNYGVQDLFIKKIEEEKPVRYIKDWSLFQKEFLDYLFNYKSSNRFRSDLRKHGKHFREKLNNNPEYKSAFDYICKKLIEKISKEFKTMYLQGYFYIGKNEIIAIAQEQNREYLMLLLFETLKNSHKDNPLESAKKIINQL